MSFYDDCRIECVNFNVYDLQMSPEDKRKAKPALWHSALTSVQFSSMGYSTSTLAKLVRKGILRRYRAWNSDRTYPSIYTLGKTASIVDKMAIPTIISDNNNNIPIPNLKDILLVNQIITSIYLQVEATAKVHIEKEVHAVIINNPLAVFVAQDHNYPVKSLEYNMKQGIVVLPNSSWAVPDLPFRYVLEEEMDPDCMDIKYYICNKNGLESTDVVFKRKNK